MPSIKKFAANISAGLAASAFFAPSLFAATLVVNHDEPLTIASPPGFNYQVQGANGSLAVSLDGFLFCTNASSDLPTETPVTFVPQHGDWHLPTATDVVSVGYNAGNLGVNLSHQTTLVCHGTGPEGEISSGLTDGIFENGVDSTTYEQYPRLFNWIAPQGFNWSAPNWTAVPTDPCSPSVNQPPQVVEDVTCAAVSGQRSAGAGATKRSPTLWTGTDGSSFFYVTRVDARFGAQGLDDTDGGTLPPLSRPENTDGAASASLRLVDAYDRGVAGIGGGYLADQGQWCILAALPDTLSGNMCVGSIFSDSLSGPLDFPVSVSVVPGSEHQTFYAGFIRPIVGAPPTLNEPAVAVSILLEPGVSAEGGDKFRGDDVVFGFLPNSQGFPWMSGGNP